MAFNRYVLVLVLAISTGGCGLSVTLTATPNPASEGQNVLFNLGVTNPSNCPLDPVIALLESLPPEAGVPDNICSFCQDARSLAEMQECLEGILGIDFAQQMMSQGRAVAASAADSAVPAPVGSCSGDFGEFDGPEMVQCTFDPIGPLASDSVQFAVPAPGSGKLQYMAIVVGGNADPNCC